MVSKALLINGCPIAGLVGEGSLTISVQDAWKSYIDNLKEQLDIELKEQLDIELKEKLDSENISRFVAIPELSTWEYIDGNNRTCFNMPKSWFITIN